MIYRAKPGDRVIVVAKRGVVAERIAWQMVNSDERAVSVWVEADVDVLVVPKEVAG